MADAFPRSRRLFVRSARPRLAARQARRHPDVSGSPVYACASGTVTFAGQVGGRGVVSIQHETRGHTIWSTYLPVTPSVSVGDTVTMGAQIGAVEERSQTLHWGAKTGPKTYVDPLRLTVDRPRLLPWNGS